MAIMMFQGEEEGRHDPKNDAERVEYGETEFAGDHDAWRVKMYEDPLLAHPALRHARKTPLIVSGGINEGSILAYFLELEQPDGPTRFFVAAANLSGAEASGYALLPYEKISDSTTTMDFLYVLRDVASRFRSAPQSGEFDRSEDEDDTIIRWPQEVQRFHFYLPSDDKTDGFQLFEITRVPRRSQLEDKMRSLAGRSAPYSQIEPLLISPDESEEAVDEDRGTLGSRAIRTFERLIFGWRNGVIGGIGHILLLAATFIFTLERLRHPLNGSIGSIGSIGYLIASAVTFFGMKAWIFMDALFLDIHGNWREKRFVDSFEKKNRDEALREMRQLTLARSILNSALVLNEESGFSYSFRTTQDGFDVFRGDKNIGSGSVAVEILQKPGIPPAARYKVKINAQANDPSEEDIWLADELSRLLTPAVTQGSRAAADWIEVAWNGREIYEGHSIPYLAEHFRMPTEEFIQMYRSREWADAVLSSRDLGRRVPIVLSTQAQAERVQKIIEHLEDAGGFSSNYAIASALGFRGTKPKTKDLFRRVDAAELLENLNHNRRIEKKTQLAILDPRTLESQTRIVEAMDRLGGLASGEALAAAVGYNGPNANDIARHTFSKIDWKMVNYNRTIMGKFEIKPQLLDGRAYESQKALMDYLERNGGIARVAEAALDLDLTESAVYQVASKIDWKYVNAVRKNQGKFFLELYLEKQKGSLWRSSTRLVAGDLKGVVPTSSVYQIMDEYVNYYHKLWRYRGFRSFRFYTLPKWLNSMRASLALSRIPQAQEAAYYFHQRLLQEIIEQAPGNKNGILKKSSAVRRDPAMNYYFQVEVPRALNWGRAAVTNQDIEAFKRILDSVKRGETPDLSAPTGSRSSEPGLFKGEDDVDVVIAKIRADWPKIIADGGFAFDADETLVRKHRLMDPAMAELIHRMLAEGIKIAIISGSSDADLRKRVIGPLHEAMGDDPSAFVNLTLYANRGSTRIDFGADGRESANDAYNQAFAVSPEILSHASAVAREFAKNKFELDPEGIEAWRAWVAQAYPTMTFDASWMEGNASWTPQILTAEELEILKMEYGHATLPWVEVRTGGAAMLIRGVYKKPNDVRPRLIGRLRQLVGPHLASELLFGTGGDSSIDITAAAASKAHAMRDFLSAQARNGRNVYYLGNEFNNKGIPGNDEEIALDATVAAAGVTTLAVNHEEPVNSAVSLWIGRDVKATEEFLSEVMGSRARLVTQLSVVSDLDERRYESYQVLAKKLVDQMLQMSAGDPLRVMIDGRSGTGKTTFGWFVVKELQSRHRFTADEDGAISLDMFGPDKQTRIERNAVLIEEIRTTGKTIFHDMFDRLFRTGYMRRKLREIGKYLSNPQTDRREFKIKEAYLGSGKKDVRSIGTKTLSISTGDDLVIEHSYGFKAAKWLLGQKPILVRLVGDEERTLKQYLSRVAIFYNVPLDDKYMQDLEFRYRKGTAPSWNDYADKSAAEAHIVVDISSKNESKWKVIVQRPSDSAHRTEVGRTTSALFRNSDVVEWIDSMRRDWPRIVQKGAIAFHLDGALMPRSASFADYPQIRDFFIRLLRSKVRVAICAGNSDAEINKRVIGPLQKALESEPELLEHLVIYANGGATKITFGSDGKQVYDLVYNDAHRIGADMLGVAIDALRESADKAFELSDEEIEAWRKWLEEYYPNVHFDNVWMAGANNWVPHTIPSTYIKGQPDGLTQPWIEIRGDMASISIKPLPDLPRDIRLSVIDAINRALGESAPDYYARRGGISSIDITAAGTDEASALVDLIQSNGLDGSQVYYFGSDFWRRQKRSSSSRVIAGFGVDERVARHAPLIQYGVKTFAVNATTPTDTRSTAWIGRTSRASREMLESVMPSPGAPPGKEAVGLFYSLGTVDDLLARIHLSWRDIVKSGAFAFDLDGTLVGKNRSLDDYPRMAEGMVKLLEAGVNAVVLTGNSEAELDARLIQPLKRAAAGRRLRGELVAYAHNGASKLKMRANGTVRRDPIYNKSLRVNPGIEHAMRQALLEAAARRFDLTDAQVAEWRAWLSKYYPSMKFDNSWIEGNANWTPDILTDREVLDRRLRGAAITQPWIEIGAESAGVSIRPTSSIRPLLSSVRSAPSELTPRMASISGRVMGCW